MASMAMTEATPIMMPSIVRNERSLLAAMARSAILNKLAILICLLFLTSFGTKGLFLVLGHGQSGQRLRCRADVFVLGVFLDLPVAQNDVAAAV